jgi:hypothetical protein
MPTAHRLDQATFEAGNYANIALALFATIGFTAKRVSFQWVSVAAFAVVIVWASVFVWTSGSL